MRHSRTTKAYQSLAHWLRRHRIDQGLSIRDLADKLGVHHSIIGKIETCSRKLDAIELVEYCQALNIDPREVVVIIEASLKKKTEFY